MFALADVSQEKLISVYSSHRNKLIRIQSILRILKTYLVISAISTYSWFITKHIELLSHQNMIILESTSFLKINKKLEVATQFQNEQGSILKPHSVLDQTIWKFFFHN